MPRLRYPTSVKFVLALSLWTFPLLAQIDAAGLLEKKTLARIEMLDATAGGVLGMTAIDLTSAHMFSYHGDLLTTQASLIKVPILVRAFQAAQGGEFNIDAENRELLTRMIRDSDNEATNKLIAQLGMAKVNLMLDQFKLPNTRLRRIMLNFQVAQRGEENTSTPIEMARLFELIYRGKVVTPAACKDMISILKLTRADFRAALPPGIEVASKPGEVPGVRTEAGIIYLAGRPYILSVMSSFLRGDDNPIRDVVEIVNQHFTALAAHNRYGHRVR